MEEDKLFENFNPFVNHHSNDHMVNEIKRMSSYKMENVVIRPQILKSIDQIEESSDKANETDTSIMRDS